MRTEDGQTIFLKDYAASPYCIRKVEMRVEFWSERTIIQSHLFVEPLQGTHSDTPLRLDGEDLQLNSIAIDGAPIAHDSYETNEFALTIFSPPERPFVVETEVILRPQDNTKLMGLYRSNGIWCTQCEPEGFRRITYFIDRPDNLATFRVTMVADRQEAPVLLANGNPVESGDAGSGRHYAVWEDPFPKPAYLFAMVAGDLGKIEDRFTTLSGRDVALAIYCEHGKQDQCLYAMDALKRSMAWDERRFGREYDLDVFNIVAVSDFNFGAMENKGLNIFNDRYVLARPEVATDADYANVESVIAHEYFHNWTGNRITCRDWFQLCLKEGLTVFRDQEFTSDERSRPVKRIEDVRALRTQQFPEDGGPLAHPARPDSYREINNFYTATVYEKGAEIVRMLATLLGEERFRAGMDLYFERHDGEATTIEAFIGAFEAANQVDLGQFQKWYLQAGTPTVTASDRYDPATRTYTLTLSQKTDPTPGQPVKEPMLIPVRFGLIGPNGNPASWTAASGAAIDDDIIRLDREKVELVFEGVANRPVPSLMRGFSAPVRLEDSLSEEDRFFLARHDADPFNRWQALQDVATALMASAVRRGGEIDAAGAEKLADALADTLDRDDIDDQFKSLALSLPSETNLARALGTDVDPQAVHDVRGALMADLGTRLSTRLGEAYEQSAIGGDYTQDAEQVRKRALRNQCLALLVANRAPASLDLARAQYDGADNMTDRIAALGALVSVWADDAVRLLGDFRKRFGGDPLVFDKWLALNAGAPDEGCLPRIEALLAEPDFPRNNPNRLRALVGTFAMANHARFASPDGRGFRFVAEFCADVDKRNPQVAARVLTAFRAWTTYEPVRRAAAREALEAIRANATLSRNTGDILERTLNG
ncbi:MAG TPA: aminopeptidase N [Devosiaceae bacterium]